MRGSITSFQGANRFLSNFYPSEIVYGGLVWPTAEHLFQALKTDDLYEREMIRTANRPGGAKRRGRKVDLIHGWEDHKVEYMRFVVTLKFHQNPDLAGRLRATGNAHIEEGNDWGDTIWGTVNGRGENHLGLILMETRRGLQNPRR